MFYDAKISDKTGTHKIREADLLVRLRRDGTPPLRNMQKTASVPRNRCARRRFRYRLLIQKLYPKVT